MNHADPTSGVDAIKKVIADGNAGDYVDVVNQVQKRFRLEVTAAQVEEVFRSLMTEQKKAQPPRVKVEMTSQLSPDLTTKDTHGAQPQTLTHTDDLAHALQFVKSVNGLNNAKRALAELESILQK